MHPYAHERLVASRAAQSRRAATARHHHLIRQPALSLFGASRLSPSRHARSIRMAGAGLKQNTGYVLIRLGLRFVDPITSVRSVPRP